MNGAISLAPGREWKLSTIDFEWHWDEENVIFFAVSLTIEHEKVKCRHRFRLFCCQFAFSAPYRPRCWIFEEIDITVAGKGRPAYFPDVPRHANYYAVAHFSILG